jgi:hypothetical protein
VHDTLGAKTHAHRLAFRAGARRRGGRRLGHGGLPKLRGGRCGGGRRLDHGRQYIRLPVVGLDASRGSVAFAKCGPDGDPGERVTTTAAPSPSASVGYPVDLQPATIAPAGRVQVYGLSCTAETGTATSQAFTGKVALSILSDATGGSATVKSGLAAGGYTVTVTCGSITATGTLTVS